MCPGIAIRCQRTINAPLDIVWEIVQDLPRWPEWDPYIVRLQRIDGGRGAAWEPGAQWVEQVRRGPFRSRFRLVVAAGCGPFVVRWRARYLSIQAEHRWSVRATATGAEVVSLETFKGSWPTLLIAGSLFRPFRVRRMTERSLEALDRLAVSRWGGGKPSR